MTKLKDIIKNIDKPLFILTLILFVLGLVMIFSASNVTSYMNGGSPYAYFLRQGLFLIVSFIFCIIMVKFNTKFYGMMSNILLVFFVAVLILLLIYGKATNYAVSWIPIGPFTLQPSEFIKIIMIVFMARFYEVHEKRLNNFFIAIIPLIVGVIITFLIMLQPDLGTAIIFAALTGIIFFSSPVSKSIKLKVLALFIGMCLVVGAVLVMTGGSILQARQLERFNFTRPCDRLLDTGNQVCNGYIAINNGGLTGIGLGNSTQKYLYLPYPYTDFIFAVIVEELGLVTGIAIIFAYLYLLYRILKIGRESYTNRGALLCYGVAVYIFLHVIVNLMGLFGLMPMTGVPLPFMSYGGSFTLCLMVSLAMVQRVNIENRLRDEKK
ncbi:MAG TPA: FtsW/RodA/SpoVE family cell cycle protein [Candidatus Onthousia faecipullorum]|uniref:Probable peptidoglycan glycosyltransferase FtsW n=1 Tax=Candidatus Onthousia faecipullorum TaxID=2840887 RepID=A0A9D1GC58_9FIRM|nr:FtsW/RodA/SpoVE family cell cycle protein [Candidatus Onthousia faecipullorum]